MVFENALRLELPPHYTLLNEISLFGDRFAVLLLCNTSCPEQNIWAILWALGGVATCNLLGLLLPEENDCPLSELVWKHFGIQYSQWGRASSCEWELDGRREAFASQSHLVGIWPLKHRVGEDVKCWCPMPLTEMPATLIGSWVGGSPVSWARSDWNGAYIKLSWVGVGWGGGCKS